MSNVSFLGAASGLPLEELVSTFVKTERDLKLNRINTSKRVLDSSLSGIGQLKSALSAFQDSVKKLSTEALNSRTATITQSNETTKFFDAVANNNASASVFDVRVTQLASGSRFETADGLYSSSADIVSTVDSELIFTAGDKTFTVNVSAGMTLNQLREAVNKADNNFGLNANIINAGGSVGSKLVFSSSMTGDGNQLTVSSANSELSGLTSGLVLRQNAQDAIIEVDGIVARSSSNTFTDVIQDLTLTAKAVMQPSDSASLAVATDTTTVKENIEDFVKKYNELVDRISSLTKPRELGDDGRTVTSEGGALSGDSLPRSVLTQLRGILNSPNPDASADFPDLFSIGITLDKNGKMEFNTPNLNGETGRARFDRVISNNFDAIGGLFSGQNGLTSKLDNFISDFNKSDGIIASREKSIQDQLKNNAKALETANRYIAQYEDTLRKRFQGLDSLLARLQSTSASVTSQLANLPGFSTQKK